MSRLKPRIGHKRVLRLEAKRAARTIIYGILALASAAASAAAELYNTSEWPSRWRLRNGISPHTIAVVFAIAVIFALLLLIATVVNGRRWRLDHVVRRLSADPDIVRSLPRASRPGNQSTAALIPPLSVEQRRPGQLPRPRQLRSITASGNVTGARPLSIAYLRLFGNEARNRTFVQGAWREFGYVHLLRSAASVTPGEYRRAKRTSGGVPGLFLASVPELVSRLDAGPPPPDRRHWRAFTDVAPAAVRVWDRYGSYPPNRYLCHGTIWKEAIDELLRRVDLVVLDLSGFTRANLGTEYELQRVIDRFPVERIVFLADPSSDKRFLGDQIRAAWGRMAAGSPNSSREPRTAYLTITDHYRQIQRPPVMVSGPRPGQVTMQPQGPPQTRLVASRGQTRRLAAAAQVRLGQVPPPSRPAAGTPAPRPQIPVPGPRTPVPVSRTPVPRPASRSRASALASLAGAILYLASVTLLTSYVDDATGFRSLFQATHGDLASPLYPHDFLTVAGLLAASVILTTISLVAATRWAIAGGAAAALGLTGYTLYIPAIGHPSPGFGAYGSSYWISLAAAAAMALSAGVGVLRSGP